MSKFKKKNVLIIFGTRPEAIKMAPLIYALKETGEFIVKVAVTGQHRELLDQVLNIFDIVPDFDFNIMKPGQNLEYVTSKVLKKTGEAIEITKPDVVLVHGDTISSTAAALASFFHQIPVGHVEAGLRTNDIYNPWPEEMNRQITARIAQFHFCSTELNKCNLINENISLDKIFITGNTVIDSLLEVTQKIEGNTGIKEKITNQLKKCGYDTNRLKNEKKLILITAHRRESFGSGFINICEAIKELAVKYPLVDFVYPVHLNPNVQNPVNENLQNVQNNNVFLTEPLDYLSFVFLMNRSYMILTDSGGIQEEAPSLDKPVLVMRSTTERVEAVDAGTAKLVGTDKEKIIKSVTELLEKTSEFNKMSLAKNPYGDGEASGRISKTLIENL